MMIRKVEEDDELFDDAARIMFPITVVSFRWFYCSWPGTGQPGPVPRTPVR
jgi:hypothetical protein